MVVTEVSVVTADTKCNICGKRVGPEGSGVCIVRLPSHEAHVLCLEHWTVLIATSYAWLNPDGDDSEDAVSARVARAEAMFLVGKDLSVQKRRQARKNGS